ncbi:BMP family ABC transporter substrate-binding protein [Phreatobacter aquaticus]|uniref:BMP family ABC transporter substrate-binding protein n=1 Tax=Phreatobacter aquaticus TaxID=2570229 RepID=A0A4D7QHI0_9HYPH|nr:BMP family ABC transporter substrate-binding protein [Phreatobacter aquaticus]QCK85143.1 BMP family ABC transporter substrate-binding protein [Phreatobacter aquaticus]
MHHLIRRLAVAAAAILAPLAPAGAQTFAPAVVYDLGGRFDKSFNEGAYVGAERFKRETGIEYRDFEIRNDVQREQALRNFAQRGQNPIVAVGFGFRAAMEKVAAEFPNTRFGIIDSAVNLPNVQSVLFKEHEGSYLVGLLAGLRSQSGTIGFVGGMDIPLIRKFACGYVQGARAARPNIRVIQNMTGTTGAAFSDPVRGAELARGQMAQGADIVFHAAGATGTGVLQAVADAGKLGIGVDSNQNALHPGRVLTSMLKRVDVAVFQAFATARAGSWRPGVTVLGLAEDGIDWADDASNAPLITPELRAAVAKAAEDIKAGRVSVHDFMATNSCPIQ